MKKLYAFHWDFRGGDIEGLFLATPEEVDAIVGQTVYFGEVLGKHSSVDGELREEDFERLNASEAFITEFEQLFPDGFGYNPLNYIEDND